MPFISNSRFGFYPISSRICYYPDTGGGSGSIRRHIPRISDKNNVTKNSINLKGICSNTGITSGHALVVYSNPNFDSIKSENLIVEAQQKGLPLEEIVLQRMKRAENAFADWRSLQLKKNKNQVLSSQLFILEALFSDILEIMQTEKLSFVDSARKKLSEEFGDYTSNPMNLRTVNDIKKSLSEIYAIKMGNHVDVESLIASCVFKDVILVTHDLAPTNDFYSSGKVIGLIREKGGTTDHSSLMASAHNIISMVHATGATEAIKTGDFVIIDSSKILPIIVNPSKKLILEAKKIKSY